MASLPEPSLKGDRYVSSFGLWPKLDISMEEEVVENTILVTWVLHISCSIQSIILYYSSHSFIYHRRHT